MGSAKALSLAATFESAVECQFLFSFVSLRDSDYSPLGKLRSQRMHSCKNACRRWPLDLVPQPRWMLRQFCATIGLRAVGELLSCLLAALSCNPFGLAGGPLTQGHPCWL